MHLTVVPTSASKHGPDDPLHTDLANAGASATNGVAVFSGSAASSESATSKADTLLATEGQLAVFEDVDGSAGYLFIQGGPSIPLPS